MITLRKSNDRGHANYGWLKTFHSFSFADYYDPNFMGFSALRVINEDFVQANAGFPTHGHRDMEIITYIISGRLQHKDTIGTSSVIEAGEVQKMTAGSGIRHSEFNPDSQTDTHLLQIWILPDRNGHKPSYEQKSFINDLKNEQLNLIASREGNNNSLKVHQDLQLFAARTEHKNKYTYLPKKDRSIWIQLIRGDLKVNNILLSQGDGAAITHETELLIETENAAEFLLFDLP